MKMIKLLGAFTALSLLATPTMAYAASEPLSPLQTSTYSLEKDQSDALFSRGSEKLTSYSVQDTAPEAPRKKNTAKTIAIVVGVAVLVLGGLFLLGKNELEDDLNRDPFLEF